MADPQHTALLRDAELVSVGPTARIIIDQLAAALRSLTRPVEDEGDWTGRKCPTCRGLGLVTGEQWDVRCAACGGTGDEWLSWKARATCAEQEAARLRAVLEGFEAIGFRPCKDTACYRPTLEMMKRAHAALRDNGRALASAAGTEGYVGEKMTEAQRRALSPFIDPLEAIEKLSDQQLAELINATSAVTSTNCWWPIYRMSRVVREVAESEGRMRAGRRALEETER